MAPMFRKLLSLTALLLTATSSLAGQTPGTGAIEGRVIDHAGVPVQHANIKVIEEATHTVRTSVTDTNGLFRSSLLPPGSYTLIVSNFGFEAKDAHKIPVTVSETSAVSITLSVAGSKESVQVTADREAVQTQTSTLGRTVNDDAVMALPLSDRNFTQILSLSPGVIVELPDATALGRDSQNVSDNGSKTTANNIQFNGVDANNLAQNSAANTLEEVGVAVPAPDTIQEFKVQTANYDAGYGRGTGANVDLVSKAGTNDFHGTVWEFVRNDIFNANLFFRKADGQFSRPVLKQNQFGATLGGPIFHNKVFFFGAYQGLRSSNGVGTAKTTVLPALTNDRSAATIGAAFCGSGPTKAGGTQLACDGSNINPVAFALLNAKLPSGQFAVPTPQILLPVTPGNTPTGQSTFSIPGTYNQDQYTANFDEAISGKDQFTQRFFYSRDLTINPFAANSANVPGWGSNQTDQNTMVVMSHTHVFNSNFVNLARAGFMRFEGNAVTTVPLSTTALGTLSPTGTSGADVPAPHIAISGLFAVGDDGVPFLKGVTNSFIAQDTVSMTTGRNFFRAGIEGKHHQVMVNQPYVSGGVMEMQSFNDFLIGLSAAQNGSPIGESNIFLTAASSGIFRKDQRYNDLALFLQDDIRLTPALSLFVGVRYEIFGSPTEAHQQFATFDPAIASGSVPVGGSLSGFLVPANFPGALPAGVTRTNRNGYWPNHFGDVSPRVGFAWQLPFAKPVALRGGYGIYFDRLSAGLLENLTGQPPFAEERTLSFVQAAGSSEQNPFSPLLPMANTFPSFIPRIAGGTPQTITGVDPNIQDPYTQEYNLNLQTSLARDLLFEIGYVGTSSSRIPGGVEFNQALLASPSNPINGVTSNTAQNITSRLPYAGISTGSILYQTRFHSNFNSLQTSLTKQLSHGLQFLASYTWSRSLDETSGTNGSVTYEEWLLSNDQNNTHGAYGPAYFDRTHRAVLSLVYSTSSLAMKNRIGEAALRNWQLSAIAVAQSGTPLTILDDNAGAVYGNFENRAQHPTSNPLTSGSILQRVSGSYLNVSAFPSAPIAPFGVSSGDTGFGDSSTGFLRGPGQRNIDFALERSFPIVKHVNFKFRTEFFNATNTPNFANPNTDVSSPATFGKILAASNNPRIIQFAGKIQF
jgi:hypothetical protein